jgi:hypothetical protein
MGLDCSRPSLAMPALLVDRSELADVS